MIDKRLSKRISFRRKIKYGLSKPTFVGYSFNLSENGIGIRANKVFIKGSNVLVDIYLGEEIIRIEGIVARVYSRSPEIGSTIGIKFTSRRDYLRLYYKRYAQEVVRDAPN